MPDASPGVARVTPDREVGEQAREGHPAVFVLDKHGTPLQPTTPARARKLLKQGRAVVTRHTPFAGCTGRGTYTRTRTDRYGFPRLRLPRQKQFFGFATGDLVRAVVSSGKSAGTHTGRVAVRASGSFNIRATSGLYTVWHKYFRLLQRADGYGYTTRLERAPNAAT